MKNDNMVVSNFLNAKFSGSCYPHVDMKVVTWYTGYRSLLGSAGSVFNSLDVNRYNLQESVNLSLDKIIDMLQNIHNLIVSITIDIELTLEQTFVACSIVTSNQKQTI